MTSKTVLDVRNLTVKFGEFTAVDDVSFSVKQGEIFGFLGANGAGKTTTIRVLCGLLPPTGGEVHVNGIRSGDAEMNLKQRVGYMSQRFTLYEDMTVGENLEFASQIRQLSKTYFVKRRNQLMEFIGFKRKLNGMVRDLPGGIKQQVSLIAAILHDPELVFLDEPTAGVTPRSRSRFWDLIRSLSKEGKTVFVTTHYMDEAEQCGRVAMMRSGKLVALDTTAKLKTETFPKGLLELDPKAEVPDQEVDFLKDCDAFSMVQPYGMRFHVEIGDPKKWEETKHRIQKHFKINSIEASLEDVFIRVVEGPSR